MLTGKKEGKMKSGAFRSEARESFWIWILLTVTAVCLLPGVNALECDPNYKGPCSCTSPGTSLFSVHCKGYAPLNQTYINDFFSKLRIHNNLATTDTLELDSFKLDFSNLTTFDLTPLVRTKMTYCDIEYNSKLTGLSGTGTDTGLIEADMIRFKSNALTTEGLDGVFKLFNGLILDKIDLESNKLTGVPDLSTLQNLEHLSFYRNKISELKAGSFRSLTNLRELNLKYNTVDYVRDSAFLIDPPTTNDSNPSPYLTIDLDSTNLKSAGFSPKSGIDKIKQEVVLSISANFDSLPQDVFLPFFEANPKNVVNLQGNKELICDSRVKWLQDRKDEFEKRVGGADCSNDPGRTVWNSKKVKGDSDNSTWSAGPPGPEISISLGFILFYIMYGSK